MAADANLRDQDRELLARLEHGDGSAFDDLVEQYSPGLFRVAMAMLGNRADAEDAVQETLAGAYRGLAGFRGESSLRTWLTRILMKQVALARRTRQRRGLRLWGTWERRPEPAIEPGEAAVDGRADVMVMLQSLSEDHRQVLVLRELQQMSYEEIARALGVPRGTIESRLHRARQELKERFEGY